MKRLRIKKVLCLITILALALSLFAGCKGQENEEEGKEDAASDNIIITETGETLQKDELAEGKTDDPVADAEQPMENTTVDPSLLVEPEIEQVVSEEENVDNQEGRLQIVFMGDSIFDSYRDGTGIPHRTAVQCDAKCYNLAIGGTRASVEEGERTGVEEWTSRSLVGVVNAIMGKIPTDIFANDNANVYLENPDIDYTQTDYFVIEYGMNDFLSATPLSDDDDFFDMKTYLGALRYAIVNLKELAPDATIILCSPTYAQFYNGDWMIGDGNSINNGYGTLFDYKGICEYAANEQQVEFFNAYQKLGIDGYTAEEYLEDGIHLTDAGRQIYADALARKILNYEETKNN